MADAKNRANPQRVVQIDVLKGLAIIAVIIQHTIDAQDLLGPGTVGTAATAASATVATPSFHISGAALIFFLLLSTRQAVPIFVILLGVNWSLSFIRRRYVSLKDGYSKDYFARRLKRFYVPYLIILAVSLLVGLFETYVSGINQISLSIFALVGVVPVYAPGNYFIILVFQFVLLFPLLFYIYRRLPRLLIVASFITGFLYQFIVYFFQPTLPGSGFLYQFIVLFSNLSLLHYLPGIALGLWISEDFQLFSKRNRFIFLGSVISIVYFVLTALSAYIITLQPLSGVTGLLNPLAFFYPTLLVLLGIQYLPKNAKSRFVSSIAYFGKASYHIFLVQMLYFNLFAFFGVLKLLSPTSNLVLYSVIAAGNIVCCAAFGILFMRGTDSLNHQFQVLRTKTSGDS